VWKHETKSFKEIDESEESETENETEE